MRGRTPAEAERLTAAQGASPLEAARLSPHKSFSGSRPSSTFLYAQLTPRTLGRLIALYEHKVFVEGVLWGIDSFDQWGVELGKTLAKAVFPELEGGAIGAHDPSTTALIERLRGS